MFSFSHHAGKSALRRNQQLRIFAKGELPIVAKLHTRRLFRAEPADRLKIVPVPSLASCDAERKFKGWKTRFLLLVYADHLMSQLNKKESV
jgi:hypothetical protein